MGIHAAGCLWMLLLQPSPICRQPNNWVCDRHFYEDIIADPLLGSECLPSNLGSLYAMASSYGVCLYGTRIRWNRHEHYRWRTLSRRIYRVSRIQSGGDHHSKLMLDIVKLCFGVSRCNRSRITFLWSTNPRTPPWWYSRARCRALAYGRLRSFRIDDFWHVFNFVQKSLHRWIKMYWWRFHFFDRQLLKLFSKFATQERKFLASE